jgi:hypothetical protein
MDSFEAWLPFEKCAPNATVARVETDKSSIEFSNRATSAVFVSQAIKLIFDPNDQRVIIPFAPAMSE